MGDPHTHRRWLWLAAVAATLAAPPARAEGDVVETLRRDLETVKRQMEALAETVRRQEALIRKLEAERAVAKEASAPAAPSEEPASALDRALAEAEAGAPPGAGSAAPPAALLARRMGGTQLRLIDVSVDTLFAAGTSTADNQQIELLEGGEHDPKRRGFTLQQAELSLSGAVDPYFTGEAHVSFTDDSTELEEAFFTTQALPYGLQLEGGHFLTEFGRLNPVHAHAWRWIDQPVINTRLLSGDGLRNPGFRLGWLVPVPWYSELDLGAQNALGDTAVSFLGPDEDGEAIGGRPAVYHDVANLGDLLYLVRWENGWTPTESLSALVGGSALFGPNSTGSNARTRIYGTDLTVKWRPPTNFRGWPFVIWESEFMRRGYDAAPFRDADEALPGTTLRDWGYYTQLLYGFWHPWSAGVRYEYATGSGPSVGGRANDPFRDDRRRVSPILAYQPTEFSRIRLQYNFDQAEHLNEDEHSVWLGFEVLYGQHPAHKY